MPRLNTLLDFVTGYEHSSDVRKSNNIYPGDSMCRYSVAHAKWHEQSANALVDLVYLMDDVRTVIRGGYLGVSESSSGCSEQLLDILPISYCADRGLPCILDMFFPIETMDRCILIHGCVSVRANTIVLDQACLKIYCMTDVVHVLNFTTCASLASTTTHNMRCMLNYTRLSPQSSLVFKCVLGMDQIVDVLTCIREEWATLGHNEVHNWNTLVEWMICMDANPTFPLYAYIICAICTVCVLICIYRSCMNGLFNPVYVCCRCRIHMKSSPVSFPNH